MFQKYQRLWRVIAVFTVFIILVATSLNFISANAANDSCGVILGEWQEGTPAPAFHIEGATAVVDGKLFVISGFQDNSLTASKRVDVYNPATGLWETDTTPRRETPLETSHISAAVDGKWVWIAGGFKGNHPAGSTREVWKYDTVEDLWYAGPELPESRASGVFQRVGRNLHYAGGANWNRQTNFSDHWTLNLDNPNEGWQRVPDMPEGRIHSSGIEVGGLLYAVGGQFGHDYDPVDLKFVHAFDPVANTWTRKADLPIARSHFEPGTTVIDGKIVIVGGRQNQDGFGQTDDITLYDPHTDQWHELRPLPEELIAPVAAYIGDQLIVTNGGYAWNLGSKETFISQVSIVPCNAPTSSPTDTPEPTSTPQPDSTPVSTEIPAQALTVIAPKNGETVHTSAYQYQWTEVPGVNLYRVILRSTDGTFKTKADFAASVCSEGICSASINSGNVSLPNNQTLQVRIGIPGSTGRSKGEWVTFRTEMPGKATLIQPSNGGSLNAGNPLLIWKSVPAAQSYRVNIKNMDTGERMFKQTLLVGENAEIQCDSSACLLNLSNFNVPLTVGVTYRWKVNAMSTDGKSKSEKWTFTLQPGDNIREAVIPLP